jgi:hypothetical protein
MGEENFKERIPNRKYLEILKNKGITGEIYEDARETTINLLELSQPNDPLVVEPFVNKDCHFSLDKSNQSTLSNKRKSCEKLLFGCLGVVYDIKEKEHVIDLLPILSGIKNLNPSPIITIPTIEEGLVDKDPLSDNLNNDTKDP